VTPGPAWMAIKLTPTPMHRNMKKLGRCEGKLLSGLLHAPSDNKLNLSWSVSTEFSQRCTEKYFLYVHIHGICLLTPSTEFRGLKLLLTMSLSTSYFVYSADVKDDARARFQIHSQHE
jgi:hypothetical protein